MSIKSEEIEKKIIDRCLSELEKHDEGRCFSFNYPLKRLLTEEGIGEVPFSHNPMRILIKAVSEVMAEELSKVIPRKKR